MVGSGVHRIAPRAAVGLVWGEDEGQILLHPDEAVTGVIAAVFARFAACGSVRGTWLWLREQHLIWVRLVWSEAPTRVTTSA